MADIITNEKIISLGTLSHNNDKIKEYIQGEIDKIPSSTVDDALSDTSEHPVQNKVVKAALDNKSDTDHTHDDRYYTESETDNLLNGKADKSDIPTMLPANGGNADMLDGLHAVDFSQIINYGNTPTDTKVAVGIEGKCTVYRCSSWTDYPAALTNGQGHIIAINYKGTGTAGSDSMWVRQIYIPANTSITDPRLYQRYISSSNLSDWRDIADGGNAATVGGAAVVTSAALGLHRLASGTDKATTTNCPAGCWYGKHS